MLHDEYKVQIQKMIKDSEDMGYEIVLCAGELDCNNALSIHVELRKKT